MTDSAKSPEYVGPIKKGETRNPGGMTKEVAEARAAIQKILTSTAMRRRGVAAYERLLEADNPLIVKDWMDRVAGKAKEIVEVNDVTDRSKPEMTPEEAIEMAQWRADRKRLQETTPTT